MTEDLEDNYEEPALGLDELKEMAAASWSESAERLQACVAVWHEDAEAGRDLLLALSIDLDVDDEDRLNALTRLLKMDSSTAAAASWLMWETEWGHLQGDYKGEAASIVPGYRDVADSLAAGLALIVTNPYLDDLYRIWAGAYRVIEWTKDSFAELRALFSDTALLAGLGGVARLGGQASGGVLIGQTSLGWIVGDSTLPSAMRFQAADWTHIAGGDDDGADSFEKLVMDPTLEQGYRLRAAEELASIDPARATRVRPSLPEAPTG
ncbi:hypothetical protein [Amycolatopsis sp. CB00013]|uniref:hypothetical protein n=1 Tax=Amycolatopsis sp. CB00013 TaxID=1703945 RepID=UPI00093F0896|nr:hypothetical protein [Amycolatopsis sp. CB00013]OKJ97542.1 hypothetical protein AMK34_11220 [Amycolatopsis sp. CB00013]